MMRGPFTKYWLAVFLLATTAIRTTTIYSNDHYEDDADDEDEGSAFSNAFTSLIHRTTTNRLGRADLGSRGLCVIGCTPYVDLDVEHTGLAKYKALVREMSRSCDIIVHVGDTKPGKMPCNLGYLTKSLHILRNHAKRAGIIALYAPGDNEINDCHRFGSKAANETTVDSDILKAYDARRHIIDDLKLYRPTDLTHKYRVQHHRDKNYYSIPGGGSSLLHYNHQKYSCDFDKYVELNHYAVATLEVLGSYWYLGDERTGNRLGEFPRQNDVDPFMDRLFMYMNAKDCALEWIDRSAERASTNGNRALFLLFHGLFHKDNGRSYLGNNVIGEFFKTENLERYMRTLTGEEISNPYQPLFDKITEVALRYPNLMFHIVHADGHRYQTIRMNPTEQNTGLTLNPPRLQSHHNVMIQQVEGDSRALTMYSRFTVDPESFQPVTHKQEWSIKAYNVKPLGHSWIPYKGP